MAPPAGKPKTETASGHPTEAQLAALAALSEKAGTEPPTPSTAEEAQTLIEELQASTAEPEPEPDDEPAEPAEDEDETAEQEAEARRAEKGAERTDKQTQAMFERAVKAFHAKLCDVFEVPELTPSGTPGVIGFLLPGFAEKKAHELFRRCQTCNGHGNVLTGSMHVGDEERACPDCAGRGYLERLSPIAPAPPPAAAPAAVTGPTVYQQHPQQNGQPEYGIPSYMGDPNLKPQATP